MFKREVVGSSLVLPVLGCRRPITGVCETSKVNSMVLPGNSVLNESSVSVENAEELVLTESQAMEGGPELPE